MLELPTVGFDWKEVAEVLKTTDGAARAESSRELKRAKPKVQASHERARAQVGRCRNPYDPSIRKSCASGEIRTFNPLDASKMILSVVLFALGLRKRQGREVSIVAISETVLVLAGGTAVLSILFGMRVAMRAVAGGTAAPRADGGQAARRSGAPDVAGVIALPPLIFLGFLAAAAVLEESVPLPVSVAHSLARYVAGAVVAASGFVMTAMGTRCFAAAGTNVPPTLPTTALVVDGIYGRTRNPLYLGLTLVYLGLSVAARSLWAIGLVVPLLWVINVGVVKREEHYLERKFGDAYRAYKARVRRWM